MSIHGHVCPGGGCVFLMEWNTLEFVIPILSCSVIEAIRHLCTQFSLFSTLSPFPVRFRNEMYDTATVSTKDVQR